MREIKFRGYCSHDKKMYSPVYFDNLEVWWWNPETDETEILGDIRPNSMLIHIEIMQYTGLKDKTGREIYEGDIVNIRNWGRTDEILSVAQIVWNNQEAAWDYEPFFDADRYDMFRRVEIIGNIYERKAKGEP